MLRFALLLALVPAFANAGTTPLKAVAGHNLEVPEAEVRRLIREIEAQAPVGPAEISIDSLRHKGDKAAYDAAVDHLARRMQWAIYELSELKRKLVRYSVIVNQANLTDEKVQLITDTSSKIAQNHYFRAIWSIAGAVKTEEEILGSCISEVCVIEISDAFEAFTRFAEKINRELDFRKMTSDSRIFWKFDRPILTASFSKTFRSMVPNNKDHNAYKVLAAGIVTPLSVAGVTTVDLLRAAGSAIFNPRYSNIKLTVDEIDIDFDGLYEACAKTFKAQYRDAANGERAKEYDRRRRDDEAAKQPIPQVPVKPQAKPEPEPAYAELDESFWLDKVKGASDSEKQACAKMAKLSAGKQVGLLKPVREAASANVAGQLDEIRRFAKNLSSQQRADIQTYVESYSAFVDGKRTPVELAELDKKLVDYLWTSLRGAFSESARRYNGANCGSEYSQSFGSVWNAQLANWNEREGNCRRYHRYYGGYSYSWSNGTEAFLTVGSGKVTYSACSVALVANTPRGNLYLCSSVELMTGQESGVVFDEARRVPQLADTQGKSWVGQSIEEYVRGEVPACF